MQMPIYRNTRYPFSSTKDSSLYYTVIFTLIFCLALLYFFKSNGISCITFHITVRVASLFSFYSCMVFVGMDVPSFVKPVPWCGHLNYFQSLAIIKNCFNK